MPLLLLAGSGIFAQTPAAPSGSPTEPFHDFRRQSLEDAGPEDEAPAPGDLEELVIGWFGPADPGHPLHGDLWTAASLAVEQANLAGGWNGRPFRLAPRWSENVWGTGVSQIARMAYDDRVRAVLGSVDGAATHLAEQVVAKARLPLVSPVSTDESVNLAGVPWMFSVVPGDHLWAPILARTLLDTIGEGRFALIAVTDHDSRLASERLLEELARLGRGPAMRRDLDPGSTDPIEKISSLGLSEVSALLLVAGPEDGAHLLQAVRGQGFPGAIFATPSLARRRSLDLAADAAGGVRVPFLLDPADSNGRRAFERLFRERTGSEPDWAAASTYDATRILLDAVSVAGPSRSRIRQALLELSPWEGVSGRIEWDLTGQNMRPVSVIGTVRHGRLEVE